MNMKEKIARAMFDADIKPGFVKIKWDEISTSHRDAFYKMAQAALDAMMEPTGIMKMAGSVKMSAHKNPAVSMLKAGAPDIYQAMIKAALEETS